MRSRWIGASLPPPEPELHQERSDNQVAPPGPRYGRRRPSASAIFLILSSEISPFTTATSAAGGNLLGVDGNAVRKRQGNTQSSQQSQAQHLDRAFPSDRHSATRLGYVMIVRMRPVSETRKPVPKTSGALPDHFRVRPTSGLLCSVGRRPRRCSSPQHSGVSIL